MGAVDIGVGHDDDALVAQLVLARSARPMPQPSAWIRSASSWFWRSLSALARGDVEDLAAQRQDRLGLAVARLLGRAAGAESPSTRKISVPSAARRDAIGELAGQAQLARGASCARARVPGLRRRRSSARSIDRVEQQRRAALRVARQPVVEVVLERASTSRAASAMASCSLVWPWNCGSRMNSDSMHARRRPSRPRRVICAGAAVAGQLAIGLEAARQRGAQALLVACRPRASARCCSRS